MEAGKVRDAADDRGQMNDVGASLSCRPGLARRPEVKGRTSHVSCIHPGCLTPIGHSHFPGGITREYAHDGAADCAGSASDERAPH